MLQTNEMQHHASCCATLLCIMAYMHLPPTHQYTVTQTCSHTAGNSCKGLHCSYPPCLCNNILVTSFLYQKSRRTQHAHNTYPEHCFIMQHQYGSFARYNSLHGAHTPSCSHLSLATCQAVADPLYTHAHTVSTLCSHHSTCLCCPFVRLMYGTAYNTITTSTTH
jgi:hypothetical protein